MADLGRLSKRRDRYETKGVEKSLESVCSMSPIEIYSSESFKLED